MDIKKDWQLPLDQYYQDTVTKKQICLHHTVGGSARSTFEYWRDNPERIGTAYIIERDGTIYEVFDPWYWAHHLGMKTVDNTQRNKESVGIELASEGALKSGYQLNQQLGSKKFDEEWLYAFDIDTPPFAHAKKLYHTVNDSLKYFDLIQPFRGYWYFDAYDAAQVKACIELVNALCVQFKIPKALLPKGSRFVFNQVYAQFNGVLSHCNVRADKSDLSPAWDWDALEASFLPVPTDSNFGFGGGGSGGGGANSIGG